MTPSKPNIRATILRGLRRRCPHCGRAPLFEEGRWYSLIQFCPACGNDNEPNPGDQWAFHYIGTALFTGVFVFVGFVVLPMESYAWRWALMAAVAWAMIGTMPHRKGLWTALDYLARAYFDAPSEVREPNEERGAGSSETRDDSTGEPR